MLKCKGCDCYVPDTMGENKAPHGVCRFEPPRIIVTPRQRLPVGRVSKLSQPAEPEIEMVPMSYWPQVHETHGCAKHIPAVPTDIPATTKLLT